MGCNRSVKLPRKLLTNRLVPHGKTRSRATHRIKAPTLRIATARVGRGAAELGKGMILLFRRVHTGSSMQMSAKRKFINYKSYPFAQNQTLISTNVTVQKDR